MKKTIYLLFTILICCVIFSCTEDKNTEPSSNGSDGKLLSSNHSSCLGNVSKADVETIELEVVDSNTIKVTHKNAVFNCCIDDIKVSVNISGYSITLTEEAEGSLCNCICSYDVESVITNLKTGTYTINIGSLTGTISL